jgi:hypothetical protein
LSLSKLSNSKDYDEGDLKTLFKLMSSDKNKILVRSLFDEPCGIPISIFRSTLAPLEAVVKYLIENKGITIKIASMLLNRSASSLYTTYNVSKKKMKESFLISQNITNSSSQNIIVPYTLFDNRNHSILETLVTYLRYDCGMKLCEIALVLSKSYSTVKTVSRRHTKKDEE